MAITPAAGYMIDPNNPNGVVKIGSVNTAAPQNINSGVTTAYGGVPTAQPNGTLASAGTITRTSSAPAPSTPSPTGTVANTSYQPNSIGPGNTPYTTAPTTSNPPSASAGMLTDVGNATFKDVNGNYYNSSGQPTSAPGTTSGLLSPNVNTSNAGLIQNQANTAQTNPLTSNPQLTQNLQTAQQHYQDLQNQIANYNKNAGLSTDVLGTVMGREGEYAKALAGQLDAAATSVNTAQTALSQAVSSYSAQTGAQNAVTTQTQPSNQTQQVGQGTTVLGANGQPLVTTPTVTGAGQSQYVPNPVTYTNGQPNATSGPNPAISHVIAKGDTIYGLAGGDPAKIAAIEAANPGVNPNNLQVGGTLIIPPSGGSGGNTGVGGTSGSAFDAGTVAGQQQSGANVVTMKSAYAQATGIHQQISTLLQQHPELNSSPVAAANAIQKWAQSTAAPSGPYVNLLQDLQEYANTISPVLGVGGSVTDNKTAIANSLVPYLAQGQTIDEALTNLEITAAGKINQAQNVGQNPTAPVIAPTSSSANSSGSFTSGGYTFKQNAQGLWVAQ